MRLIYRLILCEFILLGVSFSAAAQNSEVFPTRQPDEFVNARPHYCWYNQMQLALISQYVPTDKTLIIIARRGERDLSQKLNRRLHNVRAYLTQAVGEPYRRDPKTLILAEGERVKGFGQVEFYLDGRLIEVLKLNANGDFVIDCYAGIDGEPPCAEDWQKLFYPCKTDAQKPKQKRKVVRKKKSSNKYIKIQTQNITSDFYKKGLDFLCRSCA